VIHYQISYPAAYNRFSGNVSKNELYFSGNV